MKKLNCFGEEVAGPEQLLFNNIHRRTAVGYVVRLLYLRARRGWDIAV